MVDKSGWLEEEGNVCIEQKLTRALGKNTEHNQGSEFYELSQWWESSVPLNLSWYMTH